MTDRLSGLIFYPYYLSSSEHFINKTICQAKLNMNKYYINEN